MSKKKAETSDDPGAAAFAKVLSSYGYPFQYRTLKEASDARDVRRTSGWVFLVAEFPVEVRQTPTKIDYILRWQGEPNYLVVECKRANPSLSRWCFAKAPFVRREHQGDFLLREVVKSGRYSSTISFGGEKGMSLPDAYHIAFEMKTQAKGDSGGPSGRGAIEEASSQVCRGLYGLVELLGNSRPDSRKDWKIILLPVILTTARLFAANVNFSATTLAAGELTQKDISQLQEKEWLFYQYPVSSGVQPLRKPLESIGELMDFGELLEPRFLRSIAIVQGNHFESFLSWMSTNVGGPAFVRK